METKKGKNGIGKIILFSLIALAAGGVLGYGIGTNFTFKKAEKPAEVPA